MIRRGATKRLVRAWALAYVMVAVALAGCTTGGAPVAAPRPVAAPAPTATPVPTPTPTPVATPAPPQPVREAMRPPLVRVLLRTSGDAILPELGRRFAVTIGKSTEVVRGPIMVRLAPGSAMIQVGAYAQEANARATAQRLGDAGIKSNVIDGAAGLFRVVATAAANETDAELSARLRAASFAEQARVTNPDATFILKGEDGVERRGKEAAIAPLDPTPVRVGAKSVRGEIVVRPVGTDAGVINVLGLEEYLRGVVPGEMGPRAFPAIEALKAQAVAARTYTVAHLGDHAVDGYDICDTPACQVYGGVEIENPLTDRAIEETAGEVATFAGAPIDAMYMSTCAGRTEDAGALFPQRAAPYLKGVPCKGENELTVGGGTRPGAWVGAVERLTAIGQLAATQLGVAPGARALASKLGKGKAGPGIAGLAKAFGLTEAAAALGRSAREPTSEEVLALLRTFRFGLPARGGAGAPQWEMAVAVRLGEVSGTLQEHVGRLVPGPVGVRLVNDAPELVHDVTSAVAVFERRGESWRRNEVTTASGSPATLWCAGDDCFALEIEPQEAADAGSSWNWWVRELSLQDLGKRLGIGGIRDISVARRGVSGRALAVVVKGEKETREIPAMALRTALDLPDTLFVVTRRTTGNESFVRFLGRGWGHGVGMCQNGAYGLARGGATYQEILKHYYTGVELAHFGAQPAEGLEKR